MAIGQKDRVPKNLIGKRKNKPKPVVFRGFLFDLRPFPFDFPSLLGNEGKMWTNADYRKGLRTRKSRLFFSSLGRCFMGFSHIIIKVLMGSDGWDGFSVSLSPS